MHTKRGFTLIELMVVFAVIGILAGLATPTYQIYQQRAYGSYAQSMLKLFMDAQIMYYLEHNKFFPEDDVPISVMNDDAPGSPERKKIKDALQIEIPPHSKFNYFFYALNNDPKEPHFRLIIQSESLPLYHNGYVPGALEGMVNNQGIITISTF